MKQLFITSIFILVGLVQIPLSAQKIVEGYIYDAEKHKPLRGVTVLGKNTLRSVQSDNKGVFRLIIPEKADILIFSLLGYSTKEVNIQGLTHVEIGLKSVSSHQTESIVVIGSRDQTRTKSDAYVAVDIIPIKDIINKSGYVELTQILHYFAPSFNANRQTGADLSDHVDPVSMRGLGPDQILFLINGKRFINSAMINVYGTRGRGNVNTDLNSIPASAIERIEVLRDGAAAQYGSDAIAGVVNIVLKSDKTGTSGSITCGTQATGWGSRLNYGTVGKIISPTADGGTINANVVHSLPLDKGNLTLMADFYRKGHTFRPNNNDAFPDLNYREKFGDVKQKGSSIYWNGSYPLKRGEYYTLGGYQYRNTESYNWTIPSKDSTRNVYQIYPNGYNPRLEGKTHNLHWTSGLKNKIGQWNNDISATLGINFMDMHTSNTINPSLLLKSKTAFFNGSYQNSQILINAETNRKFTNILRGLNLAFGIEARKNYYTIREGEDASWKNYMPVPLVIPRSDGKKDTIIKIGSSQGYPGISPNDATSNNRQNISVYSDVELEISNKFLVAGAVRYEKYRDFNGTFGGKLGARYKITPKLTARLSAQTGFRVPSLAQVYFQSTVNDVDENGLNFEKIIANNTNPLSKKLSIPQLKAEQSFNSGFGVNLNITDKWTISADAYYIAVKDRIVLSNIFDQSNEIIGKDLEQLKVRQVQFFVNALNTETTGIDVNTSYTNNIGEDKFNIIFGGNFNSMQAPVINLSKNFKGTSDDVFSKRELQFILQAAPKVKMHSSFEYQRKKISYHLNLTYFSKVETVPYSTTPLPNLVYQPILVTDVSVNIKLNKNCSLISGINNLLDVYPNIQAPNVTEGGGQWESVQNGFNGAFVFSRLSVQF